MKSVGPATRILSAARDEGGREEAVEWQSFSEEIQSLVRQLIEESGRSGARLETEDDGEAVILDLQVDGVRCVLTRTPLREEVQAEGVALSPREREIARMVAKGYPNKVIARVLEISSWTVSTHLRRIFAKLGVSTRASMVAQLLEEGTLGREGRRAGRG
ncbi:MAG TPA: LuxR C-terminal-related transcriptional regulator [Thermoanaerobaculia bacterium]|nr:LuxR C-terminal-related transcriptional regulator [Thermoanaerobaculia bacterium]